MAQKPQKPPLKGPKRRLIKDIEAEIKGLEPRFFVERSILEAEGIGSVQRGRAKKRLETLDKKLASLNAELQEIREANKCRLTGVPFGPTPAGFIVDEVQNLPPGVPIASVDDADYYEVRKEDHVPTSEVPVLATEPEAQGSERVEAGSALEAKPLTWNIPEFNVFKGLSPARSEPDGHRGWPYFDAEGRAIGGLVPRYRPEVHPSSAFAPGGLLPKREENAVTEPVVATEETAKPLVVFGEEPPPFVRKPVDPKNRKKRDAKFDKYVQLAVDNPDAWGRLADVENKTSSLRAALAKTYADLTDEDGRKLEVVARRVSEPGEPDLFGFWIIFRVPTPATVDAEGQAPEMSEPEE